MFLYFTLGQYCFQKHSKSQKIILAVFWQYLNILFVSANELF